MVVKELQDEQQKGAAGGREGAAMKEEEEAPPHDTHSLWKELTWRSDDLQGKREVCTGLKSVQEWGGKAINHSGIYRVGLGVQASSQGALRGGLALTPAANLLLAASLPTPDS
ncbi:hypothetical protein NQZ68_009021 [Dissostichus eleginoides]|nr:hypothetical protein NQZ68_009021 [Dissostichus eleginoides]